MLGYMPTITDDVINHRFDKIRYLIGDFSLVVYSSIQESLGWIKTGEGQSSITYDNSFINEKVELTKENCIITMNNTIGGDAEKDSFKMLALDIALGSMDVFNGGISNEVLTFCNIEPDMKTEKEFEDSSCFKLIYKRISAAENELIVGCSKDKGKTWHPYLKTVYKRKNTI